MPPQSSFKLIFHFSAAGVMASSSKQQCRVCGGESFTTTHGLKVCDQCGRQEEHYIELLSQETVGEVDRSRLIKTRMQDPDGEDGAPLPHG